jgi:hypothetical protein
MNNRSPRPRISSFCIAEIDALQGQTLLSILRQLRDGYPKRPQNFPQSLALIGLRDVRDDKIALGGAMVKVDRWIGGSVYGWIGVFLECSTGL